MALKKAWHSTWEPTPGAIRDCPCREPSGTRVQELGASHGYLLVAAHLAVTLIEAWYGGSTLRAVSTRVDIAWHRVLLDEKESTGHFRIIVCHFATTHGAQL